MDLVDSSRWAQYIDAAPVHTLVYLNSLEFVISPWWNLDADYLDVTGSYRQTLIDFKNQFYPMTALSQAEAAVLGANAQLQQAQLNLEFTDVKAPVDGYVTNLNLRLGGQTVANQPALALVDVNSYWVDAYFKETAIAEMKKGDQAIVTLMTYPDQPLAGTVDSLGWGIAQQDGSTGFELLPNVSPTFEWIRLAQRIPVRIQLDNVPEDVALRIGTTGSVLVRTGTGDREE
jgi:multidrug resistance efflux pump